MPVLDRRVTIHFGPDEVEVWGKIEREQTDDSTTTGRLLLTIRWNDRLDAWPHAELGELRVSSGHESWEFFRSIDRRPDLGRRRFMSLELEAPVLEAP